MGINLLEPLLAGLATGSFCLASCVPFLAPMFVAERRSTSQTFLLLAQFLLGRFIGYLAFGALFGWLGETFHQSVFTLFTHAGLVLSSLILIGYSAGLFVRSDQNKTCAASRFHTLSPFLIGLLMGVNVCPPFIASLAYVTSLQSALGGIVYFALFFVATSLWLLPLFLSVPLSRLGELRLAARLGGLAVGAIFLVYGALGIMKDTGTLK